MSAEPGAISVFVNIELCCLECGAEGSIQASERVLDLCDIEEEVESDGWRMRSGFWFCEKCKEVPEECDATAEKHERKLSRERRALGIAPSPTTGARR